MALAIADKYRNWLNRFERWLITNELDLDLGAIADQEIQQLQVDILDEIDGGDWRSPALVPMPAASSEPLREKCCGPVEARRAAGGALHGRAAHA